MMQDEQIVHVAADDEALVRGFPLEEATGKRPLPAPARLGHAVDGLFHAAYTGSTVGAEGRVSGRRVAINYFTGLHIALEVGRYKVPTAHAHAVARSDGR
eukprot:1241896-Pleurochrysis_carterae.AAC.3